MLYSWIHFTKCILELFSPSYELQQLCDALTVSEDVGQGFRFVAQLFTQVPPFMSLCWAVE
jgi:hypothetical protein